MVYQSFPIMPKQESVMNTQSRMYDDIYPSQAHQYSASVLERILPYRHIWDECT
mgnify:CR=1 FL=1